MVSSRRRSWANASSVALTTLAWLPRAERLGEHVFDARRLDDRTDPAARDHPRARRRRTQEHAPAAVLTQHLVRDRILVDRHLDHCLARRCRPPCESPPTTSLALPKPQPTLPSWSPATINALNEKRRPPLTTLAHRLMNTTFSVVSPRVGAAFWLVSRCAVVAATISAGLIGQEA